MSSKISHRAQRLLLLQRGILLFRGRKTECPVTISGCEPASNVQPKKTRTQPNLQRASPSVQTALDRRPREGCRIMAAPFTARFVRSNIDVS